MLSDVQELTINLDNKHKFGEVHTPFSLIKNMFSLLPENIFNDPERKWLDTGCGKGYYSIFLFNKLFKSLEKAFPEAINRKKHILENMIYMIEINEEHNDILYKNFQTKNINLINSDFLEYNYNINFDVIFGNPPFNSNGIKKVPTNNEKNKKMDGKTIWSAFVKKSISSLKDNGLLLYITPSIWMKKDKENMFFYMTQYKLHKIHTLTNTQMNQIFKGHAQTPSCYFLMEKKSTDKKVLLYDDDIKQYVDYPIRDENILPVKCAYALKELMPYIDKYGSLKHVQKSNLPSKNVKISSVKSKEFCYPNIKTCIIKDKIQPELVIEYSNKPCPFYNKPKLVLAHGMYGFPYLDINGRYGISNRDKYVFLSENVEELIRLKEFLETDLVHYLFDATRYRMKYLEKYIFSLLPNYFDFHLKLPFDYKSKYLSLQSQ